MINKTKFFLNLFRIRYLKYTSILAKILKPIFFIKHLLLIFVISVLIYLTIPVFFNFSKKDYFIKNALIKNYSINLDSYTNIKYSFLPSPRIKITKANLNIKDQTIKQDINNLVLLVSLVDLYNLEKLKIKKIILNKSRFSLEIKNYKEFLHYIKSLKKTIVVKNSDISFKNLNKKIFTIKNVNFDNSNLNKLLLSGLLFEKKFILKFSENSKKKHLLVNMPKIGSKTDIFFSKDSNIQAYKGKVRSKILKNTFNFQFSKNRNFKIYNSSYRNNLIQSSFDGNITFNPFFYLNLDFNVKDIKLKKIFDEILNKKINTNALFNKKINGSFNIIIDGKKLSSKLLKKANIHSVLENGILRFEESSFIFEDGDVIFSGELSEISGYQKLNFDLSGKIIDKNSLLKKFNIKSKKKENNPFTYKIIGFINLNSNKVYFNKISVDNNYVASQQDLDFYKKKFEKIVLKDNFTNLIILNNFTNFINEVY